jgi:hypothetical protein
MVRIAAMVLCSVGAAADATVAAGHRARSDVDVAVVMVREHNLGVAEGETEMKADFVVVVAAVAAALQLRSWSSLMASTHLPGLA